MVNWDYNPKNLIEAVVNKNDENFEELSCQNYQFQFEKIYVKNIKKIIQIAIENSPIKKAYFLTDIQSGPIFPTKQTGFDFKDFWEMHDNHGLFFNRLYEIG